MVSLEFLDHYNQSICVMKMCGGSDGKAEDSEMKGLESSEPAFKVFIGFNDYICIYNL